MGRQRPGQDDRHSHLEAEAQTAHRGNKDGDQGGLPPRSGLTGWGLPGPRGARPWLAALAMRASRARLAISLERKRGP
jgi:hypothetical protein